MNKKFLTFLLLLFFATLGGIGFFFYEVAHEVPKEEQQKNTAPQDILLRHSGPYYALETLTLAVKSLYNSEKTIKVTIILELYDAYLQYELQHREQELKKLSRQIFQQFSLENLHSKAGRKMVCETLKKELNQILVDGKIKDVVIIVK